MVGDFMVYPNKINALLKKVKIEVGDTIELVSGERVYKGILMPHHEFSSEDILTVKLDTGYNIGKAIDNQTELKLLGKDYIPKYAY